MLFKLGSDVLFFLNHHLKLQSDPQCADSHYCPTFNTKSEWKGGTRSQIIKTHWPSFMDQKRVQICMQGSWYVRTCDSWKFHIWPFLTDDSAGLDKCSG